MTATFKYSSQHSPGCSGGNVPVTMIRVQQFGCRRSGTNYVARLMKDNFPPDSIHLDTRGKHWPLPDHEIGNHDAYILVTKNPLSWLRSIKAYARWNDCGRQAIDDQLLLEVWALKNRWWLDNVIFNCPGVGIVVRYEDCLRNHVGELNRIASVLHIVDGSLDEVENITGIVTPGGGEKDEKFDPSYYLERKYLDDLSWSEKEYGRQHLLKSSLREVVHRLGYQDCLKGE